jgi:hypothetical protein
MQIVTNLNSKGAGHEDRNGCHGCDGDAKQHWPKPESLTCRLLDHRSPMPLTTPFDLTPLALIFSSTRSMTNLNVY